MIPTKEEIESLSRRELERKYSVCSRTVQLWRREYGINKPCGREKKHASESIDKMIEKGMTNSEISKSTGCSIDYVYRRRRIVKRNDDDEPRENVIFIPFRDRERIALERKTKRWSPEHRAAFLSSSRGYLDLTERMSL